MNRNNYAYIMENVEYKYRFKENCMEKARIAIVVRYCNNVL